MDSITYEQIQQITQLVAGFIFLGVIAGVIFYVMRPSNSERFDRLAALPLEDRDPDQKSEHNG